MAAYEMREAVGADARFLADMVVEAANWNPVAARNRIEVLDDPASARYLAGWQRPGDAGVVADAGGTLIGACWFRILPVDAPGRGYVAVGVPELILGVAPIWRAQGVGRSLLRRAVELARERGHARIALSVERANHAAQLYRSEGFVTVAAHGSRDTMVRALH